MYYAIHTVKLGPGGKASKTEVWLVDGLQQKSCMGVV